MTPLFNKLTQYLLGTRKNLRDTLEDMGLDIEDVEQSELAVNQCTSCSVWHYSTRLREDLDGNPICSYCEDIVGR